MDGQKQALINEYINQCFRDMADQDYISARLSYKYKLIDQFLWSSLQSIEKYLKAILLYHGKDTKNIRHNLKIAVKIVKTIPLIEWKFPDRMLNFISYLNDYGNNRYLEKPQHTVGNELFNLDYTVWSIRKYCFNKSIMNIYKDDLNQYLNNEYYKKNPMKFKYLFKGHLEKILRLKNYSEQRKILIWKNEYFGKRKKGSYRIKILTSSTNPINYIYPSIFPWLKEHVYFPSYVINHFERKK